MVGLSSRLVIHFTDIETIYPHSGPAKSMLPVLDVSAQQWDALDPLGRCSALTSSRTGLLKAALSLAGEDDERRAAAILKGLPGLTREGPAPTVAKTFGPTSAAKYESAPAAEKRMLYRAALSYQLAMVAALLGG